MNKKDQIKKLQSDIEIIYKDNARLSERLAETNEMLEKEKENSKYWKEQWEKQLSENCDNKQRQETLNYIACSLANGLIIAKAINPDRPQLQGFNLSEYCVKLAKEIMEQAEKNT